MLQRGFAATRLLVAIVLAAGFATVSILTAQGEKATVKGVVTAKGSPAQDVNLAVKERDCTCNDCKLDKDCKCCPDQFTVKSDRKGSFRFNLAPGTYYLVAYHDKESARIKITVTAKETKEVNVTLE